MSLVYAFSLFLVLTLFVGALLLLLRARNSPTRERLLPWVVRAVFRPETTPGRSRWQAIAIIAVAYLLMIGAWHEILHSFITATIGTICLAAGMFGYLLRPARIWERVLLVAAAVLLIKPGIITDLIGLGLLAVVVGYQFVLGRRADAA